MQGQVNPVKGVGAFIAGVMQVVFGGLLLLTGLIITGNYYEDTGGAIMTIVMVMGGAILLILGTRRWSFYSTSQRVGSMMRGKDRESLMLLMQATRKDLTRLVRDLRLLAARRYFPGAYVDLNRREFVVRPGGVQSPLIQRETKLTETPRKSAGPIYMVGLTCAVCMLNISLLSIQGLVVTAGFAVAVFVISTKIFPNRIVISEVSRKAEQPKPKPAPPKTDETINTGDPELDEVLTSAMKYMAELTALDTAITNERIDGQVKELVRICQQIFDYIKKTPGKVRQIRQFMNYYLPTTIKLLSNYDELSRQPVKGDNIKAAMSKIEEALLTIRKAFEKELDSLYEDKAMDITVDIEVLENMMEQEGLTGSSLGNSVSSQK